MPSYTPTGYTQKDWKDSPSTDTPISAAALEDLEVRATDYAEQEVAIVGAALDTHIALRTGVHGEVRVAKTADETRNNQADITQSYALDDHLSLTVAASEVWLVEFTYLLTAASTAADWKFGFSGPTAGAFTWGPLSTPLNALSAWNSSEPDSATNNPAALKAITDTLVLSSIASGTVGVVLRGIYVGGANAGTLQSKWVQNTATGSASTALTGSLMVAKRF